MKATLLLCFIIVQIMAFNKGADDLLAEMANQHGGKDWKFVASQINKLPKSNSFNITINEVNY